MLLTFFRKNFAKMLDNGKRRWYYNKAVSHETAKKVAFLLKNVENRLDKRDTKVVLYQSFQKEGSEAEVWQG